MIVLHGNESPWVGKNDGEDPFYALMRRDLDAVVGEESDTCSPLAISEIKVYISI
jgi:hypothetical protein